MSFRPNANLTDHYPIDNDVIEHDHSDHVHSSPDCCEHHGDSASANTSADSGEKNASKRNLLLHHNTSTAYMHSCDFDLFETALLATSKLNGFQMICNFSRKTLG